LAGGFLISAGGADGGAAGFDGLMMSCAITGAETVAVVGAGCH